MASHVVARLDCASSESERALNGATPGAFAAGKCFFTRGEHTLSVPVALHETNRATVVANLHGRRGVAVLRGGDSRERNDTDHEELFRQESYFQYLFGVAEPGWWGTVELPSGVATLYAPELAAEYAVWMGKVADRAELSARYGGVRVEWKTALQRGVAEAIARTGGEIFVMRGVNSDSGTDIADALPILRSDVVGVDSSTSAVVMDESALFAAAAEARVMKSELELSVLRYVSLVSSEAHVSVMRGVVPGMYEYQLEARFLAHCAEHGGCRNCAYTSICACGPNSAVLHYGHAGAPNARRLLEGDMALLDMGAEYHCYCSDITCSFPVRGTFDADQRLIYEGVLLAQRRVIGEMRPGTSWAAMHALAERTILEALVGAGVLVGRVDSMLAPEHNLGAVFLPCGLGHFIGLDCHDVGGYLEGHPQRATRSGLRKLRTARVLAAGMVLTVEPGIYFIAALLDPATAADAPTRQFFNLERLAHFKGFGGVRLEDVLAVTNEGVVNFTTCPRTVDEVESVMKGGSWPPACDAAPWLFRKWGKVQNGALQDTPIQVKETL